MTDPAPEQPPDRPKWVKASLVVTLIVAAVVVLIVILSGGEHGPGRHLPGGDGPGNHAPPVEHSP